MQPFIHLGKLVDSIYCPHEKAELTNIINLQSFRFFFKSKPSSESNFIFIFILFIILISCKQYIFDLIRSPTLVFICSHQKKVLSNICFH